MNDKKSRNQRADWPGSPFRGILRGQTAFVTANESRDTACIESNASNARLADLQDLVRTLLSRLSPA